MTIVIQTYAMYVPIAKYTVTDSHIIAPMPKGIQVATTEMMTSGYLQR